jgi:quercetin dioxygenase-like cupin family protein
MRILVSVAFGIAACIPSAAFAQDPVKVDPTHHKVVLDNADVRVLRITFAPGEKAPEHEHPNSVAVFLSDGTNRLTVPGQKPTETPQKRGDVVVVTASKHSVENIGKIATEVVLVELKKPGSATYKGMSLDPTKVAPKNYTVLAESPHARVIHAKSAAGEPSVLHEHPSNVVISLIDSATDKAGTVTFAQGPEKHGGTPDLNKTANDVIIVELKSGAGAK